MDHASTAALSGVPLPAADERRGETAERSRPAGAVYKP
jgi:hypothetical protein